MKIFNKRSCLHNVFMQCFRESGPAFFLFFIFLFKVVSHYTALVGLELDRGRDQTGLEGTEILLSLPPSHGLELKLCVTMPSQEFGFLSFGG